MPLYDFWCPVCGGCEEIILKVSERDSEVICKKCHIMMSRQVSLPAKTATLWNGSWNAGLSGQGMYSQALGRKVHSRREEANIMAKKGFVSESDIGSNVIERLESKTAEEAAKIDALTETYQSNLKKFGGDKIKAVTETLPAKQMLAE